MSWAQNAFISSTLTTPQIEFYWSGSVPTHRLFQNGTAPVAREASFRETGAPEDCNQTQI